MNPSIREINRYGAGIKIDGLQKMSQGTKARLHLNFQMNVSLYLRKLAMSPFLHHLCINLPISFILTSKQSLHLDSRATQSNAHQS